ncbi:MAG: hypothetical protein GY781_19890, partial [Gammaproteobacteria bacterium]|nr:hypothetical protein [Gammaproteobacteria bacterium]
MDVETSAKLLSIGFLVVALVISISLIVLIRKTKPKKHGLLFWSGILVISAATFYEVYSRNIQGIRSSIGSGDITASSPFIAVVNTLEVLSFIVPGIMAAVAANLLTEYILRK